MTDYLNAKNVNKLTIKLVFEGADPLRSFWEANSKENHRHKKSGVTIDYCNVT